ncbi:MAG: isoleucine--tRNA ligase [Bacteroidales bacterium]|jgi:isoleucyl-tRNA synthetase|nr:isoleucine--tRNA ligase [Bacteroidales bacterium]MDI9574867.1 isoleucine--tRNA ligase [Bacteroidota bacterium]MDD3755694.1 isoleucine--tRNA ligase [Bacteroidales bacterium]MDY0400717.1 isoleucine--tRNA ligase [Bacteroidales bacterium]HHW59052.1 isoleucine--tRNA ligase [Bacteroidales bacterium]
MRKYREYKSLNLPNIANEVLDFWETNDLFKKSIKNREGQPCFVFYEGPPSANGMPGIHHVMSRTIKDLFCRYKTLKGYQVNRKAGWDTHGLPVEIAVESKLGISKEDIGKKISIADFNNQCRKEVMKYKDKWEELTKIMGYWIDLDHPYITFDNKYIETLWYLLKQLYNNGLLYKGYTIQPYSPAAGTGLSSHELNQPGCYKIIKDYSVVAQFKVIKNEKSEFLFNGAEGDVYFLAWTTTPWTLPSNTALAVGEDIEYAEVITINRYTKEKQTVILARNVIDRWFSPNNENLPFESFDPTKNIIPYKILRTFRGLDLLNVRYEQLLPYAKPDRGDPFRVIIGDFVSTEEGTGIVHIAPSFGADDFRMDKLYDIGALTLVDKQGKFTKEMGEFAGKYVKAEYYTDHSIEKEKIVDLEIIAKLKRENKAFATEKYEHSYPHCWRTDKPIIYYPLDSWFIKTTAYKERMIELNRTINWKPEFTGTGRFGNWLENMVDWNLSRTRFWGTPLPIWRTTDKTEEKCIGSVEELIKEIEKSIECGYMKSNPFKDFVIGDDSEENYKKIDLHRPYVDDIILVSPSGKPMYREPDVIDVWFDSGAMPYAQLHFPFENIDVFEKNFPADFIAEGVDQTRGWFYTLHAIATMIFDSVAFKNVIANGLVLDKNGFKMSKRLGNVVDPFEIINHYSADALRFYIITNSQPWDSLRFDIECVKEVIRRFFGTLYNTYSFFALYANIDGFTYCEPEIPFEERLELDKWILSELNSLIKNVDEAYEDYEPTRAGRLIEQFTIDHLSNWYVRLSRRRFWKGDYSIDKISAYQTLYTCLETIAILLSPIAPFYSERLFRDLNEVTIKKSHESVHLLDFPIYNSNYIDKELEDRMELAQKISSMILSLRKKANIRVRQPLSKAIIPADENTITQLEKVKHLILHETNIKDLEYISLQNDFLVKKAKPNYKLLGPKYGRLMKEISAIIQDWDNNMINEIETNKKITITTSEGHIEILLEEVEIFTEDIPGWMVAHDNNLTVALDITITEKLRMEGVARDFVNRIQNLRKDKNYDVTDKIRVFFYSSDPFVDKSIFENYSYICNEILAKEIKNISINGLEADVITVDDNIDVLVHIEKI